MKIVQKDRRRNPRERSRRKIVEKDHRERMIINPLHFLKFVNKGTNGMYTDSSNFFLDETARIKSIMHLANKSAGTLLSNFFLL